MSIDSKLHAEEAQKGESNFKAKGVWIFAESSVMIEKNFVRCLGILLNYLFLRMVNYAYR